MKLNIENWISKNQFEDSSKTLFNESILCYKTGAYKASILFSYLAFMVINKTRLLNSKTPSGIPQGKWDKTIRDLQDEENWDKVVFDTTQTKRPSPVFNINDSLRREIVYWKDKRNECAHFRNVLINAHHVESFWDFIISSLPKMTVIGGKSSLLQKYYQHFDISLTPKGLDFSELINEIEYSVEEIELEEFYSEIVDNLKGSHFEKNTYLLIFEKIFQSYSNFISEKLVAYLRKNPSILVEFLREYPQYVSSFNLNKKVVRKLWYDLLFKGSVNDFPLYTTLLKLDLIKSDDYEEAHNKIIPRIKNHELTSDDVKILSTTKFFDLFHEKHVYSGPYFDNGMANNYSSVIIEYIKLNGFTDKLTNSLCLTLKSSPPYSLKRKMKKLFELNDDLQQEFIKSAEKNGNTIPQIIINTKEEEVQ
jgi:hypothetical protein